MHIVKADNRFAHRAPQCIVIRKEDADAGATVLSFLATIKRWAHDDAVLFEDEEDGGKLKYLVQFPNEEQAIYTEEELITKLEKFLSLEL